MKNRLNRLLEKPWLPYVLPFALFLLLTGPVRFLPAWSPILYITKTILVGALLWFWRHRYAADMGLHRLTGREWPTALFCGLLVLVIWIVPEGYLFQLDPNSGFDPYAPGGSKAAAIGLIAVRLIGAAVVVPVMEELFWRSLFNALSNQPGFSLSACGGLYLVFIHGCGHPVRP